MTPAQVEWEELIPQARIGAGSYGNVYRGSWHETPVAIKVLLSSGARALASREARSGALPRSSALPAL